MLDRTEDAAGSVEYRLTAKGIELWPALRTLMAWGDAHYSPSGVRRTQRHDQDGGLLDADGRCARCGQIVAVAETRMEPGPGFQPEGSDPDPVSQAMNTPRLLLEPIITAGVRG